MVTRIAIFTTGCPPSRTRATSTCYVTSPQSRTSPQRRSRQFPSRFPLPEEQTAIAAFLDRETGKINALTAEAQRGIELLKERRSALISAAVTGKIDVRSFSTESEAA